MNYDFSNNKDFFSYNSINFFNNNHKFIIDKLNYFIEMQKIPNLILYGGYGIGKKHILEYFITKIYDNNQENIDNNVIYINCCHGKGNIKFIREDLKFFAKSTITTKNKKQFKSIILINADKLTIDAQSALRRSIEIHSNNTRFFIVVNDCNKLIKPIISRFCDIYIPRPIIKNKFTNYYNLLNDNNNNNNYYKINYLKKFVSSKLSTNLNDIMYISTELYNKGFSALDLLKYIDNMSLEDNMENLIKYKTLAIFENIRREFRNEIILIFFLLNYIYIRCNYDIKNIV